MKEKKLRKIQLVTSGITVVIMGVFVFFSCWAGLSLIKSGTLESILGIGYDNNALTSKGYHVIRFVLLVLLLAGIVGSWCLSFWVICGVVILMQIYILRRFLTKEDLQLLFVRGDNRKAKGIFAGMLNKFILRLIN